MPCSKFTINQKKMTIRANNFSKKVEVSDPKMSCKTFDIVSLQNKLPTKPAGYSKFTISQKNLTIRRKKEYQSASTAHYSKFIINQNSLTIRRKNQIPLTYNSPIKKGLSYSTRPSQLEISHLVTPPVSPNAQPPVDLTAILTTPTKLANKPNALKTTEDWINQKRIISDDISKNGGTGCALKFKIRKVQGYKCVPDTGNVMKFTLKRKTSNLIVPC